VVERVVELEALLLEPALHEAEVQVLGLIILLRLHELTPELRELLQVLARLDARLRARELLRGRLVRGIASSRACSAAIASSMRLISSRLKSA
jgi:hypothetical protein